MGVMDLRNVVMATGRLRLETITSAYREEIFREFTPEITCYMYPPPARAIAETDGFIAQSQTQLAEGTDLVMVILIRESGEFIGCCGIHKLGDPVPELGIWIKKGSHGNGYGREAVGGLIAWARKNLPHAALRYPVDRRNTPSRKIPESHGGLLQEGCSFEKGLGGNDLEIVEYLIDREC